MLNDPDEQAGKVLRTSSGKIIEEVDYSKPCPILQAYKKSLSHVINHTGRSTDLSNEECYQILMSDLEKVDDQVSHASDTSIDSEGAE